MEKENISRVKVYEIEEDSLWTMRRLVPWIVMGFFLLALAASSNAQVDQRQGAFHGKAKSDYSKPGMKKQSNANFSNVNLSAQQMIDFFKNENIKLSKEISDLIEKVNPNSESSIVADETDMMHVAILKNKLDYFEGILKKWINDGNF